MKVDKNRVMGDKFIQKLNNFSQIFSQRKSYRHLLFIIAALLTVSIMGYYFGTFDQVSHVPFLKKTADPTLYPNDQFFNLRLTHYSYFWNLFQPLYRLGILEISMFAVHILATYLTFWALWTLSMQLFNNPLTSLISTIAFIIPRIGFADFPILEFSLLNRTAVLPFLLWAIIFYLRRRFLLTFILLGLLYNLHVISVNFVLIMVIFDLLLRIREGYFKKLISGLVVFTLGALPVLLWRFSRPTNFFQINYEWFDVISRSVFQHLFFPLALIPYILIGTISGISTIVLVYITRRSVTIPKTDQQRTIIHFIWAIIAVLIVEVLSSFFLPLTPIIQMQIIRIGIFASIFGYLYFAHYLAVCLQSAKKNQKDTIILAGSYIFLVFPMIPILILALQKLIASVKWRQFVSLVLIICVFIATITVALTMKIWSPGIYVFGPKTAWYDVQVWARNNTPIDALFITPPQMNQVFYESDWRVFSERSTVVNLSELLEAAFSPEYISYWKPRFEDLAPGALTQFRDDFLANSDITRKAYYSISAEEILKTGERYGASYLVIEKPYSYPFPILYENDAFLIYDIDSFSFSRS